MFGGGFIDGVVDEWMGVGMEGMLEEGLGEEGKVWKKWGNILGNGIS